MDHWDEPMFPWAPSIPRFYPPGCHPAMHQQYAALRQLNFLADQMPLPPNLEAAVAYARDTIAAFEERESELKAEAATHYEQD